MTKLENDDISVNIAVNMWYLKWRWSQKKESRVKKGLI